MKFDKSILTSTISSVMPCLFALWLSYFIGAGETNIVKNTFMVAMPLIVATKIILYHNASTLHYALEFCFALNLWTVCELVMGNNVMYMYPLYIGPVMACSIFYCESIDCDDINNTLSFFVHMLGVITLWMIKMENDFDMYDDYSNYGCSCADYFNYIEMHDVFVENTVSALKPYFVWYAVYFFYTILYNGNSVTTIRNIGGIDNNTKVHIKYKVAYLIFHPLVVVLLTYVASIIAQNICMTNAILLIRLGIAVIVTCITKYNNVACSKVHLN